MMCLTHNVLCQLWYADVVPATAVELSPKRLISALYFKEVPRERFGRHYNLDGKSDGGFAQRLGLGGVETIKFLYFPSFTVLWYPNVTILASLS